MGDRIGYQHGLDWTSNQADLKPAPAIYFPPPPTSDTKDSSVITERRHSSYDPSSYAKGANLSYQPQPYGWATSQLAPPPPYAPPAQSYNVSASAQQNGYSYPPPALMGDVKSNLFQPPPVVQQIGSTGYFPPPPPSPRPLSQHKASLGSSESVQSANPAYYPPPPPSPRPLSQHRASLGSGDSVQSANPSYYPPPPPRSPANAAPNQSSNPNSITQGVQNLSFRPPQSSPDLPVLYAGPEHAEAQQQVPDHGQDPAIPKPYDGYRPDSIGSAPLTQSVSHGSTLSQAEAHTAFIPASTPGKEHTVVPIPTPYPQVHTESPAAIPSAPNYEYTHQSQYSDPNVSTEGPQDKKSSTAKRFVGNMLVGRVVRSGYTTMTSTVKAPFYLSPWGDNNPITLPCVRKRDIALMGVMHFGVEALAPGALTLVEEGVKYAATLTTEQAIHQGTESAHGKAKGRKSLHKVVSAARPGIVSLEIRIKHKLMGEEAEIVLHNEREAVNKLDCNKGWFCPYLYASGRTPQLARGKDFGIATFLGPGLTADASLAPTLLAHLPAYVLNLTQSEAMPATIEAAGLTPQIPGTALSPAARLTRLLIMPLGISPYRTTSAWSQARIGGEARLKLHVFPHLPSIVVPLRNPATFNPVQHVIRREEGTLLAWSSYTVSQILAGALASDVPNVPAVPGTYQAQAAPTAAAGAFDWDRFVGEVTSFLTGLVDQNALAQGMETQWMDQVGQSLKEMVGKIRGEGVDGGVSLGSIISGSCEPDRVGLVMLRF